jgi:hypothetical protein
MNQFEPLCREIETLIQAWEPRLLALPGSVITERRNAQNRTIKQILGHLVDSASNNTHRIIHLHYQPSPMMFPDYAHFGNNDRWIAIQHYQEEDWKNLVQAWKFCNLHLVHLIRHADMSKLKKEWIAATGVHVSMEAMITDYPKHLKLHLGEIEELIKMQMG